ncbi:hypothetical protein BDN72DRAFT_435029 [Pluteus cervinus]|uniref:Uncharacterized protein n=1 Tax=Pluteus cervinus TaxID=181527 RepID=A0ACD3A7G5_9AGAR|nr:hypothetical protein BDN72DRAFT_435029 [Pluteus cervinus]
MSSLPSNFPKLPRNVGGYVLPDFLNAKVIGEAKLPPTPTPERFDFSIKKSGVFGTEQGVAFDEGATWFPLKLVRFTSSSQGIRSYQGLYGKGATAVYGRKDDASSNLHKLALDKDEYITGLSGTYTDVITSLHVKTTNADHKIGTKTGTPFEFNVPADHHVVGFYGRADQDHLRAIGISYSRRLASITPSAEADVATSFAAGAAPKITAVEPQYYLDAATRQQWANGDMDAINNKRMQASKELQPIYENIKDNGGKAWVEVESAGQRYYLSFTDNATIWAYTADQKSKAQVDSGDPEPEVKRSIVSIGSYSRGANFLGISSYIWDDLSIEITAVSVALTFATLLRPIVVDGVTWGIEFAATQLAETAASLGFEELALAVPASVASAGGLIITGIIGVALYIAVLFLLDKIFRQYFLTINVFNFDPDHVWKSVNWHSDNADISSGEWRTAHIRAFAPAGTSITPPGFDPVKPLDSVVTYLAVVFVNHSTFLEGLGVGLTIGRDDNAEGLALKYVVHRFGDNQIGLQGFSGNAHTFDLDSYYKGDGWVTSKETTTSVGNLLTRGYTPSLTGAPDQAYQFDVNLGVPPSNF